MIFPTVQFSELYQPTFSTQTLIPISILTDCIGMSYSPGIHASGRQLLTLFALAAHLNRNTHDKPQRVIAIGNHGTLFAKMLLNMSTDYVVDSIVKSLDEQNAANAYINSPNLFKCYFFGPLLDNKQFAVFDAYDVVVFTDTYEIRTFPMNYLPETIQIVTPVEQTKEINNPFDAYDEMATLINVKQISTLVTGREKLFTVSGVKNAGN
jgi:hypothetical protein